MAVSPLQPLYPVNGQRSISPTTVTQFIHYRQCERYLRLSMQERAEGTGFLQAFDVQPELFSDLLAQSGRDFERLVEEQVRATFEVTNFADTRTELNESDNAGLLEALDELQPGSVLVFFQVRITTSINAWRIKGDVDIIRAERTDAGELDILLTDMKSSRAPKVEHRLQVAFYKVMLETLLAEAGIAWRTIDLSVLYRGSPHLVDSRLTKAQRERLPAERDAALATYGVVDGLLEVVENQQPYLNQVAEFVTGEDSLAERLAEKPFEQIPYVLDSRCDGCRYSEFCMKWTEVQDDLSGIPFMSVAQKSALHTHDIRTTKQLADVKDIDPSGKRLVPADGHETQVVRLASEPALGGRLDDLILRAKRKQGRLHQSGEGNFSWHVYGHGSLPYTSPEHNPNLINIFLDVQVDYVMDRAFLVGALVVGHEAGVTSPGRTRSVVRMLAEPPRSEELEREMLLEWTQGVVAAIAEVAAPNASGELKAPIHLIFYDEFQQMMLLDALARHFETISSATPLYDFVTQIAAFDSPMVSYLENEIRDFRRYPMVCQSLQSVATYLRFDWTTPLMFRERFGPRVFDYIGRIDDGDEPRWFTRRARFNSTIPLEYAYGAWNELDPTVAGSRHFLATSVGDVEAFAARRLDAMQHIAVRLDGNYRTTKNEFDLTAIATFEGRATGLAAALREFVTIERHVALAEWKRDLRPEPERRVLDGGSLLVEFRPEDHDPEFLAWNEVGRERLSLRRQLIEQLKADNPDATARNFNKAQKEATKFDLEGLRYRLHLRMAGVDGDLAQILSRLELGVGSTVIIFPRLTVDSRLPLAEQEPFTPTPRQMMYGMRVTLEQIETARDDVGAITDAWAHVSLQPSGARGVQGYVFGVGSDHEMPLIPGTAYSLDRELNDWMGSHAIKLTDDLIAGAPNTLYDWLSDLPSVAVPRGLPAEQVSGQRRFLQGLAALHAAGALHAFEAGKQEFIGEHADDRILLVQGPPGTGKSYATAFAVLARIQGALAVEGECHVLVSCKTHAAVDVLLQKIADVQQQLAQIAADKPELFAKYIDRRVLAVPLGRQRPTRNLPESIVPLDSKNDSSTGRRAAIDFMLSAPCTIVGATPGGIRSAIGGKWKASELFGHELVDLLVIDEASQISLPESLMAALPLKADGQLIVVGDHRQMAPIVQHAWQNERRRTFQQYEAYASLFNVLLDARVPIVRFEESFRLHAEQAEFLRRTIYQHDGIHFHSQRQSTLQGYASDDAFVNAVLALEHPLVVVLHDEARSQAVNQFETELIAPVLETLSYGTGGANGLDAQSGLGVVTPHRAQRAAVEATVPAVVVRDPETGLVVQRAVDTVERFQGDERDVIVFSATESDPQYLVVNGEFLTNPQRFTVGLSRAKKKTIVVASRSVFELFSNDEQTFSNIQIWKSLLHDTCTVSLWSGERSHAGTTHHVEVWGNRRQLDD